MIAVTAAQQGSVIDMLDALRRLLLVLVGVVLPLDYTALITSGFSLTPQEALAMGGVGLLEGLKGKGRLQRCAEVWVRPDRRFEDRQTCERSESLEEIAARGGLVLFGSSRDVSQSLTSVAPNDRCEGPETHANNASFIGAVRAQREEDSPPIAFVHLHRFDLVPIAFAALPGFDAAHLAHTTRPWIDVLNFFSRDASPACLAGGCRWSDSFLADPSRDEGTRLRDLIDRSAGSNAYRHVVYYLPASGPGKTVYWPTAALADLANPEYRAWRIEEARRALEIGGYDAIMLNEKFYQYSLSGRYPGGHWLGGTVADVEQLNQIGTTLWSAPPTDYGHPEYVQAWAALGSELRREGIPYAVWMNATLWRLEDFYDDPSTSDVHEETSSGRPWPGPPWSWWMGR